MPATGLEARVGNVTCGQTLTESTIVENDLEGCAGDGLLAGADGITIDLNGHTIDSQTLATGDGIVVSGVDGVVVKNGTITGFEVGVSIVFGADRSRVQDLRISGSAIGNGIEAQAGRAAVTGNTVFGRAIGIVLGGQTTTAAGNTVKDNDTGMFVGGSRAVVTRNTALSNAGDGIQAFADRSVITGTSPTRTATTALTPPARSARRSTATARPSTLGSASTPTGTCSTEGQRGDRQRQPAPVRERRLRRGAVTLEGCVSPSRFETRTRTNDELRRGDGALRL